MSQRPVAAVVFASIAVSLATCARGNEAPASAAGTRREYGAYFVDGDRLFFAGGGETVEVAVDAGMRIRGSGTGGLIVEAGNPTRVFSLRHGTREFVDVTATLTTGGTFRGLADVLPTSTGHLVIRAELTCALFWTDGTPDTLEPIRDGALAFDAAYRLNGRVFVRGRDVATDRCVVREVVADGSLTRYGELVVRALGDTSGHAADADFVSSTRLFKRIGGMPHASPVVEDLISSSGEDRAWEWRRAASGVIWAEGARRGQNGATVGDRLYFPGVTYQDQNGDRVYDQSGVELYRTDGTAAGTRLAHDFDPRKTLTKGNSSMPSDLIPCGERRLVLVASDAEGDASVPARPSIWAFDGEAATRIARDVEPAEFQLESRVGQPRFLACGNHVYYVLKSPNRFELWQTDGTSAGTHQLVEAHGSVGMMVPIGKDFLFSVVRDGKARLWACDGTADGTRPLGDTRPVRGDVFPVLRPGTR